VDECKPLQYGPTSAEVVLPNSATKEQLTIVCALGNELGAGNNLPSSPLPNEADSCKFTKELKAGINENQHSTSVESPPPPRVCMSTHPEGKSRSISVRVLVLNDPPARWATGWCSTR